MPKIITSLSLDQLTEGQCPSYVLIDLTPEYVKLLQTRINTFRKMYLEDQSLQDFRYYDGHVDFFNDHEAEFDIGGWDSATEDSALVYIDSPVDYAIPADDEDDKLNGLTDNGAIIVNYSVLACDQNFFWYIGADDEYTFSSPQLPVSLIGLDNLPRITAS